MIGDLGVTIPDLVEPIVAYRAWKLDTVTGQLTSINNTVWPTAGPLVAACVRPTGFMFPYGMMASWGEPCDNSPSGPDEKKSHTGSEGCGVYAFKSVDDAIKQYGGGATRPPEPPNPVVFGEVLLSGKVYDHTRGYRAQRAWIHRLYDTHDACQLTAERYVVDLAPFDLPAVQKRIADAQMKASLARAKHLIGAALQPDTTLRARWVRLLLAVNAASEAATSAIQARRT